MNTKTSCQNLSHARLKCHAGDTHQQLMSAAATLDHSQFWRALHPDPWLHSHPAHQDTVHRFHMSSILGLGHPRLPTTLYRRPTAISTTWDTCLCLLATTRQQQRQTATLRRLNFCGKHKWLAMQLYIQTTLASHCDFAGLTRLERTPSFS